MVVAGATELDICGAADRSAVGRTDWCGNKAAKFCLGGIELGMYEDV